MLYVKIRRYNGLIYSGIVAVVATLGLVSVTLLSSRVFAAPVDTEPIPEQYSQLTANWEASESNLVSKLKSLDIDHSLNTSVQMQKREEEEALLDIQRIDKEEQLRLDEMRYAEALEKFQNDYPAMLANANEDSEEQDDEVVYIEWIANDLTSYIQDFSPEVVAPVAELTPIPEPEFPVTTPVVKPQSNLDAQVVAPSISSQDSPSSADERVEADIIEESSKQIMDLIPPVPKTTVDVPEGYINFGPTVLRFHCTCSDCIQNSSSLGVSVNDTFVSSNHVLFESFDTAYIPGLGTYTFKHNDMGDGISTVSVFSPNHNEIYSGDSKTLDMFVK